MLLAVDIGNTSIKFGVFDGEVLTQRASIPTNSTDLADALAQFGPVSSAAICSVVPAKTSEVRTAVNERFGVSSRVVANTDDFGLVVRHRPIDSIGTDRLVNAYAAATRYGVPVIVCSLGTATTIDAVSKDRELLGGLIAPGMRTAARALHSATARLPEVEPGTADSPIAATTEDAIRAGLFYSQVGLIEVAVSRMKADIGQTAKVVATGGLAQIVAEHCEAIDVVNDHLVLDGLRMLSSR
jgi:type III pantothenate kinase